MAILTDLGAVEDPQEELEEYSVDREHSGKLVIYEMKFTKYPVYITSAMKNKSKCISNPWLFGRPGGSSGRPP